MDYRQIIAIFIPILVDQAFVVLLNMLNTAMVSSSGVAAVSAVSMVDSVNLFLLNVFIAVSTGGTVVVAQFKGAGNDKMVTKAAEGTLTSVALLAVLISVLIIIFHNPILNLLFGAAEPDVFHNAQLYLIGSAVSYPFFAIFEASCGALRGVAETKSSLMLSLVTNISLVLLNVLFINGLRLGVLGLVISLNAARFIGMVVSLVYLIKFNRSLNFKIKDALKIDWGIEKKVLFVGIPFAAEQLFFNGGKILTQTFIVGMGTLSMATNAICNSLVQLFVIAPNAMSLTAVTVVGQCLGRRNVDDARKFIKSFLWATGAAFVVTFLILMPLFPWIVQMFNPPGEILHDIWLLTLIGGILQTFIWGFSFELPSALRAAGDSRFTSVASMLSMWLFRVVMGYVLGVTLGFGIMGVWAAMYMEWCVRGTIFFIRFRGKKWYAHNLTGL